MIEVAKMLKINVQLLFSAVLMCSSLFLNAGLSAKQLDFGKHTSSNSIHYRYAFVLPSGKRQTLSFRLNRLRSEESRTLFTKQRKQNLINRTRQETQELFDRLQSRYLEQARDEFDRYINEQASQLPVGIRIQNQNKGEHIRASSDGSIIERARAKRLIDQFLKAMNLKWQGLNQQYLDAFEVEVTRLTQQHYISSYRDHYYVVSFSDPADTSFKLRVDFAQVARIQSSYLKPVANAIAAKTRGLSRREVLNYVAHFIQSIPYDTLNSRDAHHETGFVAPLTLFDLNRGDCDTKSTALAAIMHNLYPDLAIKIVLIPNHAFVAVDLKYDNTGTVIFEEDKQFSIIEAAGPSLTPVGQAYESSLQTMQSSLDHATRILPVF